MMAWALSYRIDLLERTGGAEGCRVGSDYVCICIRAIRWRRRANDSSVDMEIIHVQGS